MKHEDVTFASGAGSARATPRPALHGRGAFAADAGRPVVVMAHGLAGTVDSGLVPFAEALAGAGLDVLAFDYRGFGASEGEPGRPSRWPPAEGLPRRDGGGRAAAGVDPRRLVLWGCRSRAATSSPPPPTATTSPPWSR